MNKTDFFNAIIRHPEFLKDYKEYLTLGDELQAQRYNELCVKWRTDITAAYAYYINSPLWNDKRVYDYGLSVMPKPQVDMTGGRYLYLRIDLTKTRDSLVSEFQSMLRGFEKLGIKRKTQERQTDPILNHWDVYDAIEKNHKTLSDLAQNNTGKESWDDDIFKSSYKKHDRAYKKACILISKVNTK
ncbi:MAG: hypothetical protein NT178_00930 [Proteobacteria bacterium]|nr:hypothetical protein [Pseudomonadota bacterium]